jgi:acyl dehydratase
MRVVKNTEELERLVGTELGVSDWLDVTQALVDGFAEVTGDRQWIHIDPERARRESLFGGTIAHGYLTLSLIPILVGGMLRFEGARARINYGLDRVRFPSPVRVGARIRGRFAVLGVERVGADAARLRARVTIEIEGETKPACIAEPIILFLI